MVYSSITVVFWESVGFCNNAYNTADDGGAVVISLSYEYKPLKVYKQLYTKEWRSNNTKQYRFNANS